MIKLSIKGRYQDRIITRREDGTEEITVTDWRDNQVQDSALKILAHGLEISSNLTDYYPLKYMAIGTGTPSTQPFDQETLESELVRLELANFVYLDSNGTELSPQVPSNRFKTTVTLGAAQANGTLTEFGLVGGDATSILNSGYLFNWVTHDPFVKTNQITIERTVDITITLVRN